MASSSFAVRAGRAFVELFANDTALTRTLDRAQARVKAWAGAIGGIGAKAGAAGGSVLAPLGKALFDALGKGSDIKAIATRFQQGTGSVSELAGAFEFAGVGVQEFGDVVGGLEGKIIAAADANGELVDGLRGFGLRGRELIGLSLDKQLERIFNALGSIEASDFDLANQAEQLFGSSGARLVPYLKEGVEGLKRLKAEAHKSGAVMPVEDIERAATATRAWNAITVEVANSIVAVGSALLPTTDQTKDITERIRDAFAAGREWVAENKNLIIAAAALGAGLVGLGATLVVAKVAFAALAGGVGLVSAAFTLLLSPVGLAAAALAGVAAWFITCTDDGKAFASEVGAAFSGMGETFRETWGGIVDAVKAGDLPRAFEILGAGVKALWRELLLTLKRGWNSFVKGLTDVIKNNPMLMPVIGAAIGTAVGGPVGTAVGLAAGTGLNFVDFEKHLSADLGAAADDLKAAKDELRGLLAGRGGRPGAGGPDELGDQVRAAMKAERERFEKYGQQIREQVGSAQALGDRQKGIFSGPVAQQLAVGDKVATRQLAVQQNIDRGVQQVAKGVDALGKNVAVFGRK